MSSSVIVCSAIWPIAHEAASRGPSALSDTTRVQLSSPSAVDVQPRRYRSPVQPTSHVDRSVTAWPPGTRAPPALQCSAAADDAAASWPFSARAPPNTVANSSQTDSGTVRHMKTYTVSQKKRLNFETVQLEIIRINFDAIWQKCSKYSRIEFACFIFHVCLVFYQLFFFQTGHQKKREF